MASEGGSTNQSEKTPSATYTDDTTNYVCTEAVADLGFPVGGRRPRRGGANSRGSYVLKNLYVKTKESGPIGGARTGGTPWNRHCEGHIFSTEAKQT